jgi:hypothetical protein
MPTPIHNYQLYQLQADLQALLGDYSGTRFTIAQLNDAINWGIKELNTLMGFTYTEVIVPQNQIGTPPIGDQNGTNIPPWVPFSLYGLYSDGITPYDLTDYIEIKSVLFGYGPNLFFGSAPPFTDATIPLNKTNMESEDIYNPNWRNSKGIPQRWDFYDSSRIVVFPFPYAQTLLLQNGYLTVGYVQQPQLLSNPTDYIDNRIPDRVQQYVKYAGASWLLSLDQSDTTSLATAKAYMDTFTQLLQSKSITP